MFKRSAPIWFIQERLLEGDHSAQIAGWMKQIYLEARLLRGLLKIPCDQESMNIQAMMAILVWSMERTASRLQAMRIGMIERPRKLPFGIYWYIIESSPTP